MPHAAAPLEWKFHVVYATVRQVYATHSMRCAAVGRRVRGSPSRVEVMRTRLDGEAGTGSAAAVALSVTCANAL